jgi:hypothetical protein
LSELSWSEVSSPVRRSWGTGNGDPMESHHPRWKRTWKPLRGAAAWRRHPPRGKRTSSRPFRCFLSRTSEPLWAEAAAEGARSKPDTRR